MIDLREVRRYHVEVDSVGSKEWERILTDFDDASLYQTWEYARVFWGEEQTSRIVLFNEEGPSSIAQVRTVPVPVIGGGIAYLMWAPLWRRRGRNPDTGVLAEMITAVIREYSDRRGLCLRVNPRVPEVAGISVADVLRNMRFVCNVSLPTYHTLIVDLQPSLEVLRKGLQQKWRNQLNKSEKNGLDVVSTSETGGLEEFLGLAKEMVTRKGFSPGVDYEMYHQLQGCLPEALRMRTWVCYHAGAPVSAAVCSVIGDTAEYLLGATGDVGLHLKGAYLLQWQIVTWLKDNGFKWYDLGGINPANNPGVYHFKNGIGGKDVCSPGKFDFCSGLKNRAILALMDRYRRRR